jgi:hypothetical protein
VVRAAPLAARGTECGGVAGTAALVRARGLSPLRPAPSTW